jgi:hypothetical protein
MTPEEKQRLDQAFAEITKTEKEFLKEYGIEPNEHGAYVFISQDGNNRIALDLFLSSYRTWLIENDIHCESEYNAYINKK